MSDKREVERRSFLKMAAATAAVSIMPARTAFGADANSKLRVGLTGCGGRGPWIADLFNKCGKAQVVACHDYFVDRVRAAGKKLNVPEQSQYAGFDGYKQMFDQVDIVAVESPPYFHPEQAVAALEAGKHVYIAKPIAVDVPGCLAIVDAATKNNGKLNCFVDFQTRNNEFFKGAAQRVHDGIIGKPILGHVFYHTGRLGRQARPGSEAARLRNWVFDKALSGDIIVEQNIHVLDVANWYIQNHPIQAVGTGGRKGRVDVGDCWDHFVVAYTYPDDVHVDFSSRQFGDGFDDLCIRLYGETGTVDSHYGGDVKIRGKSAGWAGGNTGDIYQKAAADNVRDVCTAILDGKPFNNAQESANSTLTSILGRMAAYENRLVTWDEMMEKKPKIEANLNLPPEGMEFPG
ncbi:MAG: Gfo/Idh/MocA family oxidoreductase [Candidatus Hydrogenedentes bacterium]|nr:Gfo/Idh/MocA family oxidoreductase [Candidatus Hydrogenedentota bacterium]